MLALAAVILVGILSGSSPAPSRQPPEGIPGDSQPFAGLKKEGISAWAQGNVLYLDLSRLPATQNEEIKITRLANVVNKAYFHGDSMIKVQLQPEPDHWLIKFSERPKGPLTVLVMELDAPALAFDDSRVLVPDSDGVVNLSARFAVTHGSLLRYEPQAHKNTVGYWANVEDTAEWHFEVTQPGLYEVDLLQGCGKGHGGSRVEIQLDGQKLPFEVQETGHFQNFIWRTLGKVDLPKTRNATLKLMPLHKAAGAVMDVRAIRLVPVGQKRSFESELADPVALPK
jgi:hypothetical protein